MLFSRSFSITTILFPSSHFFICEQFTAIKEQTQLTTLFFEDYYIDKSLCAEIHDCYMEVISRGIITSFMIHGICDNSNPKAPCMEIKQQAKSFPKEMRKQKPLLPHRHHIHAGQIYLYNRSTILLTCDLFLNIKYILASGLTVISIL